MWSTIIASSRIRESYSPELKAIINRANLEGFTLPSKPTLQATDILIQQMITDGYWVKRDLILNYAYNDDTLEDFTRINWKNPNGNLSTYVRENKYNLCGPSEDFSNSSDWGRVGTGAQIDSNVTLAPNSTMTADRWTNGTRLAQNMGNNIIPSEVYNWSVYAKADSGNLLRLHINSNIPTGNAVFDLSTGTVVSTQGLVTSASISNEGNGWYRCSIVYTAEGSLIALNSVNSGESIFIWGAQLTRGAALQTYQNTVNRGILVYDNQGVIGSVSSIDNYVDTNWNILNDSIAYLLDDASREAIIYKPASFTANVISGILSSVAERWPVANVTANVRINQGGANITGGSADLRNEGYKAINRISSTDLTFFNKNVTFNRTANSTVIPNDTITIHRATTNAIGDNVISYFSAGASTVAEAQNFRTAYNTYLTSIGLSPIA